jgi:2-dehydro-3-deoxyphosphooctonate aldolase (KDO 8-P synthase)
MTKEVKIGNIRIGTGNPLVLIAGPCVIESPESCLAMAQELKRITAKQGIPFIFKSSFDKANRLSLSSYRGPGLEQGLKILSKVKKDLEVPVLSDVHCREELEKVKDILDVVQIPALLSRQTDLIIQAANTAKAINIKKGQFLAPWDIAPIIKKAESTGTKNIMITERGVSFGYNNLVSDFRSISIMREFGYPVIYDATHSVQLPGGSGKCSSGQRQFVASLSRAAVAVGVDGLFLEVHSNPAGALCDGPNMIDLKELELILKQVKKIQEALR